jgi:hypothetical protein
MSFRNFFTKPSQYPNLSLALVGSLSFVLYLFLSRLGLTNEPERISETLHHFFAIVAALFVLLFLAALIVKKSPLHKKATRWSLVILALFAVLFRGALLGQAPWLSNDVYRYLWDAQLFDHGVNPYALPPAAEELAQFRDPAIYPRMDHKNVHSVYPPLLQILFWAGRKTAQIFNLQPFTGLKLIFALIDSGLVLVLFRLLVKINLDPRWAILYAWHPLPLIEIAGSGHTDGVGALTLVLAVTFLWQRRYGFATIFLALGFLVKFIPALLLPFLLVAAWKDWGLKKAGACAAIFVLLIAGTYTPFAAAGEKLISGLMVYSEKWRFNDGFFSLVFSGIHAILPDRLVIFLMIPPSWEITAETLTTRRIDLALHIVKAITGAVFMLIYVRLLREQIKTEASSRTDAGWLVIVIIILAAFFLLSPTLQPWYLIWLLPLLAIREAMNELEFCQPLISALLALSATVFLSYWVLEGYIQFGVWHEPAWVKWVEYGFPLIIGLWLWSRHHHGRFFLWHAK